MTYMHTYIQYRKPGQNIERTCHHNICVTERVDRNDAGAADRGIGQTVVALECRDGACGEQVVPTRPETGSATEVLRWIDR